MIKGILLSITLAIFLSSVILTLGSSQGYLKENIITGNVIGISAFIDYALIVSFISLIFVVLIIIWIKKS
jgi:hypothetical protein